MRKKLLLLFMPVLFSGTVAQAQDRDWKIGTTSTSWPIDLAQMAANSPNKEIDGLTLVAGASTFGGIRAADYTFSDGYVAVQEWQSQGNSQGTAALPVRRYFSFPVDGPSTIKVWFRANGDGPRSVRVGDGTDVLGELGSANAADAVILTAEYNKEVAGTIYINSDLSVNYHRISVTSKSLATDNFQAGSSIKVYANKKQITVDNVISNTQIDVYSITGALVKSVNTNTNTRFDLPTAGFYIVKAKSVEGVKTTKIAIQ